MVVVFMISPRVPSFLFDTLLAHHTQAFATRYRPEDTTEGAAYVCSYNFSRVEEYWQWLRVVGKTIHA